MMNHPVANRGRRPSRLGLWRRRVGVVAAVAAVGALAACSAGGGSHQPSAVVTGSIDDLVTAARAEGTVTWYTTTGSDTKLQADLEAAFKAKYGITLDMQHIDEAALVQQYYADAGRGTYPDVVLGSAAMIDQMKGTGDLGTYVPPVIGTNYSDHKYQQLAPTAFPASITPLSLNWNTNLVPDYYPTDFRTALLDPRFKGKLGVADPNTIGGAFSAFWSLKSKYSPRDFASFLQGLAGQNPQPYTGNGPVTQAVASGDLSMAWLNNSAGVALVKSGAPMEFAYPAGTPASLGYMSVVQKASHPNAARLFMNWFLSADGQQIWADDSPGAMAVDPHIVAKTGLENLPWYKAPDTSTFVFDSAPPTADDKTQLLQTINSKVFKK